MKAYVEGIHYYKTHRVDSLAILSKYLRATDAEVLTEVYEDIGISLTSEKPYPTLRGIEVILRELAAKDPRAKTARAEDFVNLAFMKELDGSGFIDRLYKARPVVARYDSRRAPEKPDTADTTKTARALAKAVKSAPGDEPLEYTVQAGDTLSMLALRHYGDVYKWDKIYEANKTRMKNPDYIYVGQKILIPA
jgi:hypothetical protein